MNKMMAVIVTMFLVGCGQQKVVELIQGDSGSNGIDGATGAQGEVGAQGDIGDTGATGAIGAQGAVGATGPAGLNGSTFEVVKPCPSTHVVYSEIFLKIGGKLYALYDGGPHLDRLVELVNGTYMTTDGRNCIFTVSGGNIQ